jgi:hypothetical protein
MITHCTRFGGTGADVTMQVSCGGQSRRIRIDILNRDMSDPHAGTPEHTFMDDGLVRSARPGR